MTPELPTAEPREIVAPRAEPLFTRQSVFCVLLLAACLLATWPVAEIGINDDWSYVRITQIFAHTGHFVYNGWGAPILGWQVLWGALFARLFGDSYTVIRLSLVPVALATALLYHAVLRRFGLNSRHATFGTLTFVLSPLFLPLAATFMTDVSGLFPIIFCIFLCQLALSAESERASRRWLIAAALTNIILGSVRQTAWLGVLIIVPSCAWVLRRRRYIVPLTVGLWVLALVCVHLTVSWYLHHPYSVPEKLLTAPVNLEAVLRLFNQGFRGVLTTLLLCLPVLALGLAALFPLRRRTAIRGGVLVLLSFVLTSVLKHHGKSLSIAPPWIGTTVSYEGLRATLELLSPHSNPAAGMLLFLLFCLLCLWAFVEALVRKPAEPPSSERRIQWRSACVLLLPFLAVYSVLLMPRSAFADSPEHYLWDRYLLLILPIVLVFLLGWHQERVTARIPAVAILVLILFAFDGVAGTHDLFALERARVRLLNELQRAGIPRTAIRGGFPFDGVTQVEASGYVNEPAIVNPPDAYHPLPFDIGHCGYWFNSFVPSLHAKYEVETQPNDCVTPAPFPRVSYRTWLPPRSLTLWTGVLPASGDNRPDAPVQKSAK